MIEHAIMITTKGPAAMTRRLRHVEAALGLEDGFIEVLDNRRDLEDSVRGCFVAHKTALTKFLKTGKNNCLILEDDVHFLKPVDIAEFLAKFEDINWQILYLGHRPVSSQNTFVKRTSFADVLRVRTNDLHAAIISRSFASRVMEYNWYGKAIDVLMRNDSTDCYAAYPMPAVQTGAPFSTSFWNGYLEKVYEYIQYSKTGDLPGRITRAAVFPFFAAFMFLRLLGVSLRNRQIY